MRNIKVRARDVVTGEILTQLYMGQCIQWVNHERQNNIIIEEWAGLADNNGSDIYEGDLLAWPENSDYVFKVEFKLGCYVARCYHNGELSSVDYLNPTLIKRKNAKCPLEVIGNIHQNPELLEK